MSGYIYFATIVVLLTTMTLSAELSSVTRQNENQNTIEFNRKPGGLYSDKISEGVVVFGAVSIAAIIAAAIIASAIF